MWANDPEMAKKWEKKEKKMKETKVKQLIKKMVREIISEAKRMNYKERDWKKINKIAKRKDVFIQTSYGDQFKWEEGSNYGVFATEEDGREIELDHDDIDVIMVEGILKEKAKRDYKAEYKKYGSSKKAKKYRAELNKYNRQKGTYGNGDGLDASHKGGKIVGFEEQSKNRGRAEKSRLKKEAMSRRIAGKTLKIPQPGDFGNDMDKYFKALNKHMKEVEKLAKLQKKKGVKEAKNKGLWANIHAKRKRGEKPAKPGDEDYPKTLDIDESGIMYKAGVKKYGKEGMKKIQQAAGKGEGHAEIGKIKDKYDKKKKKNEQKLRETIRGILDERMDKRKAATILKQIGGNRFIAMTGAKGFAFSDKYMSFKIGRNSKGINFVRIGHNAKDLYDMEFGFVSTRGIKVKKKVKDVYADMLGQIFKKHTGMNVSL